MFWRFKVPEVEDWVLYRRLYRFERGGRRI